MASDKLRMWVRSFLAWFDSDERKSSQDQVGDLMYLTKGMREALAEPEDATAPGIKTGSVWIDTRRPGREVEVVSPAEWSRGRYYKIRTVNPDAKHRMPLLSAGRESFGTRFRLKVEQPEDATALAVRELTELRAGLVLTWSTELHGHSRAWLMSPQEMIDEIDARLAKLRQGGGA